MIKNFINRIFKEYSSYTSYEKKFIFFMMIISFMITGEASITRAVGNSVFLSAYTVNLFPTVWIVSVPLNLVLVTLYNRFIPSIGCIKMCAIGLIVSAAINLFSAFYLNHISFMPFILYIWKDIFVILMFQQVWSVIHSTINVSRAKYLYGIFFGMGGIGSVFSSCIPGFFAVKMGSEKLLLMTIPYYILIMICYFLALKVRENISTSQDISSMKNDSSYALSGLKLIVESKILKFILLLVIFMQVSSTILEFQFNSFLEKIYPIQDIRTQFLGRFFGLIGILNIFLQFIGGFVIVRILSLKGSHFFVPLFICLNAIAFLIFPTFQLMCMTFASIKSLDYSIFGIIKEMLYIPLKVSEKFKAKAIIDVFVYRSSKAFASLIIITLQCVKFMNLFVLLSWGVVIIFSIWIISVIFMFKYYDYELKKQHLNWPESTNN